MSNPIYKPFKMYSEDLNDLITEDLIEKGKALPIGTHRMWSGGEYVKHPDGWVHVSSGKLTSGKKMEHVENHPNAKDHEAHAKKHVEAKSKAGSSAQQNQESMKRQSAKGAKVSDSQFATNMTNSVGQAMKETKEAQKRASETSSKNPKLDKALDEVKTKEGAANFLRNNLFLNAWSNDPGFQYENTSSDIFISAVLARYSRQDHGGGEDGDEWMSSEQVNEELKHAKAQHSKTLERAQKTLKELGVDPSNASFDLGEKGHFCIQLTIPKPTPKASAAQPQAPKAESFGKYEYHVNTYPDARVVFGSIDGPITVSKRRGKFYADVNSKFDITKNTWAEMEKVLKDSKATFAGYDDGDDD